MSHLPALLPQKIIAGLIILFIILISLPAAANGQTPQEEWVDKQLNQLDTDKIQDYWQKVITEYHGFLPESQKMDFKSFLKTDKSGMLKGWLSGAVKYLFHELLINGKLLGTLIMLTVFSMILQAIQNAFEHKSVSKVAYAVVYLVLIILSLNSFRVAITYTTDAIESMSHFLLALMPLVLALTASVGSITSVAFFHPLIVFLINSNGWLVANFVLPLLFLSALLQIVSTLTDHYKVTKLAALLRNIAIGTLAVFFAVFLGVMSVQGAATAISDGVLGKTAKFLMGNFVPVVGRMFTDATETVISASMLLKNTVGLAGLVILICLIVFPALKVLSLALIYNLAAAILQPLGGGPVIESLSIMAKSLIYIFAALVIVSLMFFLAVTIIIAAGNLSIMAR
ncbi:stage III sporulation protein AE [Scopulibacillus darangshiensis]|uniref:Stage III sporulation protein AE n=1 Tax=Scopulibacillus darangshiensis TaxID=442528 RepID=A0A4R2P8L0_9BACL|nr:stage III sporulation protein AE [Scopulibacillus darangshiensis]TCP31177.1 stage III sporulation protein AE [Scopulibacillus darangshiensis]